MQGDFESAAEHELSIPGDDRSPNFKIRQLQPQLSAALKLIWPFGTEAMGGQVVNNDGRRVSTALAQCCALEPQVDAGFRPNLSHR